MLPIRQPMKMYLALCVGVVLVACLAARPVQEAPCVISPHISGWEEYDYALSDIDSAPEWPSERQLTREEWRFLIALAVMFQKSNPHAVETAIICYMITIDSYVPKERHGKHWRERPSAIAKRKSTRERFPGYHGTNLMLVLRLMFEIPEDDVPVNKFGEDGFDYYQAYACGGMPSHATVKGGSTAKNRAAPIHWSNEGPTLTAFYGFGAGGGGLGAGSYDPHWEYRYFLKHYPYRKGLERFLAGPDDHPTPLH